MIMKKIENGFIRNGKIGLIGEKWSIERER